VGAVVVGAVELVPLLDAVGELGALDELFPDTEDWEPSRELYPEQFAGSQWRIACNSYLIRSGGVTVLVDTGVGPAGLWGWKAEREEGLFPALAAAGASPEDVEIVVLTHLHIDHVGWNTDREGRLCFPNARYVTHREGLELVRPREAPHVARAIRPVTFEEIDGETELAEAVTAFPLPGHLAGHMGLLIESNGERAVLIADTAVCPLLLDEPDRRYVSDADPAASAATRRALLPELLEDGVLTVCGHYPDGGIGRVVERDGRIVWEALGAEP
jgi:glyoxylase-like metal-dependent hydrolase (beta-lactamase superfamily II)